MLSLQKLRNFVAVAEERQFLRASVRLGIAQPTLSAQIRELEDSLGVSLFNRTTRQIALTIEGERFYHRTKQILGDLELAVAEAKHQAELRHGKITIAATPSVASAILPRAIAAFSRQFADIAVRVIEDVSYVVEDQVRNGLVNFGVGPTMEQDPDLSFTLLLKERFLAVLPLDHPLADSGKLKLAQIAEQPIMTTSYGTGISDVVEGVLRDNGFNMTRAHSLTRHETVIAMVEAGLGVAILPELGLQRADNRKISIIPISDPPISRNVGIIERKGGSASSASAAFLTMLKTDTKLKNFQS